MSDYERLRLENIKRNQQFLAQIGLQITPIARDRQLEQERENVNVKAKEKTKKRKVFSEDVVTIPPERRSARIEALGSTVDYKESSNASLYASAGASLESDRENGSFHSSTEIRIKDAAVDRILKETRHDNCPYSVPAGDAKEVSRNIIANIDPFLESYLGKPVEEYGKAAVMSLANDGVCPRFNKYSGVVEWANGVFLWVNVGAKLTPGAYENSFHDGARSMVWFGGSKMTEDSPVIRRMIKIGTGAAASPLQPGEENIMLFVRIEGEPYVCLGRVALLGCDLQAHPVVFSWTLLDRDGLLSAPSDDEKDTKINAFRRIVEIAGDGSPLDT